LAKPYYQQGRNASGRGGPRKSASESTGRSRREDNTARPRHSTAEKVANFWPLAILPGLAVTLFLRYFHFLFMEEGALPERIPVLAGIATAFVLNSLFTIWFYGADKRLAEQQLWRIPELSLHFWELFCGWPGALYAQKKFHHKWKKTSFMVVFWLNVVLNVAAVLGAAFPEISLPLLRNANDALMQLVGAIHEQS